VPCFKNNKLLDPKRAITWYLKKTEPFRVKDGKDETSLFINFTKPHNRVSKQTISSWLVKLIQTAYDDKTKKVKAHSTSSVGPSWALFNGASIDSIIQAADWSR